MWSGVSVWVSFVVVVVVCISLITNDVSIFSCACWPFVYVLRRNVYSSHLSTFFTWVVCILGSSFLGEGGVLYIFDTGPLSGIWVASIFSYFVICMEKNLRWLIWQLCVQEGLEGRWRQKDQLGSHCNSSGCSEHKIVTVGQCCQKIVYRWN